MPKVVGYYVNTKLIANSYGEVVSEPPYLDWLLSNHPEEMHVFYHAKGNMSALLKLIGITEVEGNRLFHNMRLSIPPYEIGMFGRTASYCSIAKGHGEYRPYVYFYDASQYIKMLDDTHFEPDYSPEYAIARAKEAADICQVVSDTFNSMGLDGEKLTSPVKAFEKQLSNLYLPIEKDLPDDRIGELAYESLKGNWLECWHTGYWEHVYDYDINGAYASEMVNNLYDTRRGQWIQSLEVPDNAVYGFARGTITTWADFHPFLLRTANGNTYTPVGEWETVLTLSEIRLMHEYKLGEFFISDGWWWLPEPAKKQLMPLRGLLTYYWNVRKDSDGLKRKLLQRCLAGTWGKFTEIRDRKKEFGPLFFSPYGAVVEANVRCKVVKTCLDAGIKPLSVAVDGVITDKPLPVQDSRELGEWRLSHEGRCIICSSGVIGFEGKQGTEEFALRFSWLDNQIKQNPKADTYSMKRYSPMSLGKALQTGEFDKLGEITEVTRAVSIHPDFKRLWHDTPQNGGQLVKRHYDSSPLEVSMVQLRANTLEEPYEEDD